MDFPSMELITHCRHYLATKSTLEMLADVNTHTDAPKRPGAGSQHRWWYVKPYSQQPNWGLKYYPPLPMLLFRLESEERIQLSLLIPIPLPAGLGTAFGYLWWYGFHIPRVRARDQFYAKLEDQRAREAGVQ